MEIYSRTPPSHTVMKMYEECAQPMYYNIYLARLRIYINTLPDSLYHSQTQYFILGQSFYVYIYIPGQALHIIARFCVVYLTSLCFVYIYTPPDSLCYSQTLYCIPGQTPYIMARLCISTWPVFVCIYMPGQALYIIARLCIIYLV
jgi:hypothetical protein